MLPAGVKVGNRRYMVEAPCRSHTKYQPDLALRGVKKLIGEDQVKFILMLGGNDFTEQVRDFINQHRMLVSTFASKRSFSRCSDARRSERGAPHLQRDGGRLTQAPSSRKLKTVAMLPGRMTCTVCRRLRYVSRCLRGGGNRSRGGMCVASRNDRFRAYRRDAHGAGSRHPVLGHGLRAVRACPHDRGVQGGLQGRHPSCTCDNYGSLSSTRAQSSARASSSSSPISTILCSTIPRSISRSRNEFYAEFCKRFPGTWSAVSWEYASTLELWKSAAQSARTFEPNSVLAMMKLRRL